MTQLESPLNESRLPLPPYTFLAAYGRGIELKAKVFSYGAFIFA